MKGIYFEPRAYYIVMGPVGSIFVAQVGSGQPPLV